MTWDDGQPERTGSIGRRMFMSLTQHRNYRLFFTGQIVSLSGTWMQNVAMYWLVLELTGSAFAVGVLSFARFLPTALLAPFAGTLADRLNNRRAVMGTQAAQMVLASALMVLAFAGVIEPWHLYAVAALTGTVHCLDGSARGNLTYEMVGRRELPNAIALNNTLFNGARVGGPAVGGVVISAFGVEWCFLLNSITFLAVLASLAAMRVSELFPLARTERPRLIAGTREGLAFARKRPEIMGLLALVAVYSALLFNVDVLLPILARQTLDKGADTFALLVTFYSIGALLGSLVVAWVGRASWRVVVASALALALIELMVAPLRSVPLIGGLLLLGGASFAFFNANANSLLQMRAPDHLRGRMLSLYMYAWVVMAPLGAIFMAWLCEVGGTGLAFVTIAAIGFGAVGVVQWWLARADVGPSVTDAALAGETTGPR
jgi:MFS family permease